MTEGLCQTCEQLFHILQELIDNNGKDKDKDLKIIEQKPKLILNAIITMLFGRTSRRFNMKFELESIQLDDITRLENIINEQAQRLEQLEWNMNDRFNNATKLISLYNNFRFRSLSSTNYVNLSDNDHQVSLKIHNPDEFRHQRFDSSSDEELQYCYKLTNQDAIMVTNQPFSISSNQRYQLIRFNVHLSCSLDKIKLFMGVIYESANRSWSDIASSSDTWLLNISDGSIQHSNFHDHPYTWPLNRSSFYTCSLPPTRSTGRRDYHSNATPRQTNLIIPVDLLVDTHKRCLAFRVQDQTEDRWAFHLPERIQINQLYPLVIFAGTNISVSIDFSTN